MLDPVDTRIIPSLISLPTEIISQIADLLEQGDAVALGRTARIFLPIVEQPIWRSLHLYVDDEVKWPLPRKEQDGIEDDRRVRLRKKAKAIILRADERRWGLVETITMTPLPESVNAMIQVLDFASPTLRSLDIIITRNHYDYTSGDYQSLARKMIDAGITFHALTSAYIEAGAIQHAGFITLLCNSAPRLTDLDVGFDGQGGKEDWEDAPAPGFPPVARKTQLRHLRVMYDGFFSEEREWPLVKILENSPGLKTVSLTFFSHGLPRGADVARALSRLENLDSLNWYASPAALGEVSPPGFERLRRLVLEVPESVDPFSALPPLSNVRLVLFDRTFLEASAELTSTTYPSPSLMPRIPPHIAASLSACPKLRYVHCSNETEDYIIGLSDLSTPHTPENPRGYTGAVRSVRYGKSELLYLRLLLQEIEPKDDDMPAEEGIGLELHSRRILYAAGPCHTHHVKRRFEPVWQGFSDMDGLVVPMEVMERMWEVEGKSMDSWEAEGWKLGRRRGRSFWTGKLVLRPVEAWRRLEA